MSLIKKTIRQIKHMMRIYRTYKIEQKELRAMAKPRNTQMMTRQNELPHPETIVMQTEDEQPYLARQERAIYSQITQEGQRGYDKMTTGEKMEYLISLYPTIERIDYSKMSSDEQSRYKQMQYDERYCYLKMRTTQRKQYLQMTTDVQQQYLVVKRGGKYNKPKAPQPLKIQPLTNNAPEINAH